MKLRRATPNLLSSCRLLAAAVLLTRPEPSVAAFLLVTAAGATDLADGYLARRWGVATRVGALLDAAGDKAMLVAGLWWVADDGLLARLMSSLIVVSIVVIAVAGALADRRSGGNAPSPSTAARAGGASSFALLTFAACGWQFATSVALIATALLLMVHASTAAIREVTMAGEHVSQPPPKTEVSR